MTFNQPETTASVTLSRFRSGGGTAVKGKPAKLRTELIIITGKVLPLEYRNLCKSLII
jgi:hypothetical protein